MINILRHKQLLYTHANRWNYWLFSDRASISDWKLGKPTWSLRQLGIENTATNGVIDENGIDYLANLAKIDLTCSQVKREEIIHDVNVILNCSKVLKKSSSYVSASVTDSFHEPVSYKDGNLRIDNDVMSDKEGRSTREKLLANAPLAINSYYATPKVKD